MTINWRKTFPDMKMRGLALWLMVLSTILAAHSGESAKEARVVCYYTNWSVYRPGTAKFNPQNINPYLCTHLIYAFGGFTKENTLKPFDKYQDIEKGGYAKFTGLKTYNPNLKTMIAIGGWNEGSSRFSALVASSERRREFVKNSIKFLRQNKFDGLDLDWEYPSFRDGGKPKDKGNYARLVQELREEFDKESSQTGRPRLLLTMAVPAGVEYIDKGYDVPKLNRYLDWMNLLSYDYHSAFEPSVNHHSPLYPLEAASEYNFESDLNIDFTIKRYIEAGADPEKIVLGIPTYGRSFTLFNPDSFAIGAPADGPGEQGDATREKGYLAYYEICESLMPKARSKRDTSDDSDEYEDEEEEWTVVQPNPRALGPYAYKGNQWVGYDDIDIVRKKAEYVAENHLGGIMFWSIDNDDFRGKCHNKPYPLIEAAKESLYKSLGITETVAATKKPTSTRKRPRPSKPSKSSDSSEDKDKNTIKGSKKDSETESKFSKSSSGRRQNQSRRSTTESTPVSYTPAWGLNTPEPPTTPDPGSDFKCIEEGFFPHPRDCKKYFWCLESGPSNLGIVAHQFTCPSGLYFNKAADSCDFARNVLCNKKKAAVTSAPPATTTKASTTTSSRTTTTAKPSQLSSLFTTRRPSPRITAATSSTTLLFRGSTTPSTVEEEYEDEEEDVDDDLPTSEEDPKVIKELVDLIKKLGGVEQLEKYLSGSSSSSNTVQGSITTTQATIPRLLYERVLSQARPIKERAPPQQNSRGPQSIGPIEVEDKKTDSKRGRPQYTTINRQRPASTTTEKSEDHFDSADEEDEEEDEVETKIASSTSRPGLPQYVNIRRARPTTQEPESTARYSTINRNPEDNSQESDERNSVQNKDYSSFVRSRPDANDGTTSKYKTIQRVRSTTTEATSEVNNLEINNVVVQGSEDHINPNYSSTFSPPAALVTEPRNQFSEISAVIESTTLSDSNNDIDDVNVEIASPSFTSENGIITNTGSSSVLNAQITTLSNTTPKPVDENNDTTITNPISYSTKVTISEEVSSSTQRSSSLFAKRTRPTTTTVKPQDQSDQIPDNKVSLDRTYGSIKRTRIYPSSNNSSSSLSLLKARLRNEISSDPDKDLSRNGKSESSVDEAADNLAKLNGRPGSRKIRSTTPASHENQDDSEADQAEADYGNKRFVRPQLRFTARKLNSKPASDEEVAQNVEDQSPITSNGENGLLNRNRPVISQRNSPTLRQPNNRLRKFFGADPTRSNNDNESSSNEFVQTEVASTTNPTRSTPNRKFRPSYGSFESDLSSLTSIDNTKRRFESPEPSNRYRNAQVNRRFRPALSSTTNQPQDDSDESDSSITPVISDRQRSFGFRGGSRFTTAKPTLDNTESNSDVSESSIPPRGRKFNIARFSPRPFSFSTANVEENTGYDDLDLESEDENELNTESPFDAKLLGKARLSAPVINISEEDKTHTLFKLPTVPSTLSSQQSINVTKIINSNSLLGQTNNRSGILLLRRPSTSTLSTKVSTTTPLPAIEDDNSNDLPLENIHLSETTIEEKEQDDLSNALVTPERPRKRIIVKKHRSTTPLESSTTEATIIENDLQEDANKGDQTSKQRIKKVLRRRPATTTATTTTQSTTEEPANEHIEDTSDKPVVDDAKNNQTNAIPRVRKIIRRKLKPILTDEGKTHILQTKNEDNTEDEREENDIKESSSITPLINIERSTTENIQIDLLTEQTTFTSSSTRSKSERPSYRPIKRPINIITSTEPSTTTVKTYSRKYINGPFTTPSTLDRDPNAFIESKPRIETNPRRTAFGARPFSKRPFTTSRTTTINDDEYDNVDDEFEEEEEEEEPNKLVFVPVDQLFTRGPTIQGPSSLNNIVENVEEENKDVVKNEEVVEDEEEKEEEKVVEVVDNKPRKILPPVIKLGNRFNSPQPPAVQARGGISIGRESNRPSGFNRPTVSTRPAVEEANKRFNRPVAFQPNRVNRPGFSPTSAPTESTSKYLRKLPTTRATTEITPATEAINIENVNKKHKQLFGNPKRFSSTTSNPLDDTTEDSTLITTDYSVETTTEVYDATEIPTDSEVIDSTTEEATTMMIDEMTTLIKEEESSTEKPKIETHVFSVNNTDNSSTVANDVEENTVYPFYNVSTTTTTTTTTTTEKPNKIVEPSVRTTTLLDKLFEVSRVVEVTSTQEKHRLNRKNESRLIERGEVVQEKKPRLDKIGEVSRFTLIKIVERDIPIYLTNLSHEYPVANPPFNPIRIDEARNARTFNNFSDSGKENLIASESVNSAYNHRNALIDIIDAPAYSEHLHSQFTAHNILNRTDKKLQSDVENKDMKSITPRSFVHNESSTLAIEGLFNGEESSLHPARQVVENDEAGTGSKAFVVYAAPQTEVSNDTESDRAPSGRSLTNYVKIQVLRPDEESSKVRNKEFFGVPAAVDVMHEKENPLSKQPFKISILNQEDLMNKTDVALNTTEESVVTISTTPTTTTVITSTTTAATTVTEEAATTTTDTPISDSSIVKIKSASITNNTLTKIAKKRPKLTFPRRAQTNQLKTTNITRLSIIPSANRASNTTADGKNVPFTTPKYNRTNSYTSGRSRFSAIKSQNVPVDPRRSEAGKSRVNSTSEVTRVATDTNNKKITIKPLRPGLLRGSTFSPRRTTLPPSQDVEESTTPVALSDVSASENTIKLSLDQNKVGFRPKPAFFPRRSSSRFTTKSSDRSTSTPSPKDVDADAAPPTTPAPAKRRLTLERRRPTSSPTTTRDPTDVAATTRATSARPTRLFVRKYTGPRSGNGATKSTTTASPVTKSPENTSRKNFRIGVRKRPTFGIASSSQSTTKANEDVTTVPSNQKTESDQEFHSTVHQTKENSHEIPEKRRVKIQKRPLSNAFKLNQVNADTPVKAEDKQTSDKIYSSVIKEDHTLVQQEKTFDTSKNEVQNVEDVTADVAVVAHQLLSAPLPTIPSYALDDQSNSDNTDSHQFTRAYLLASSASPIVNNDEYLTTSIRPQLKFSNPTKTRRISTTVAPHVVSTIRTPDKRRKSHFKEEFQKIEPVVKNYRQFVDYEYYDDDDIKIVGKTPTQGKVIVHGQGRIQCLDQGNFPHPESCKKFISCARMENGEVYGWAYTCPAGLSFDPVGGICNWSSGLGCSD